MRLSHHVLILMPASLITLVQRVVSACRRAPNSSGVPPPTSVRIFASEARTASVLSAPFTAPLMRATMPCDVPDLTKRPAQSSATSRGYPVLKDRGHVIENWNAFTAHYCQCVQLTAVDEVNDGQDSDELVSVHAAQKVPDRLRKLGVGHVRSLNAGFKLE